MISPGWSALEAQAARREHKSSKLPLYPVESKRPLQRGIHPFLRCIPVATALNRPLKGPLSLYRWSPPPLWRGLRPPACYKPDERNPSQNDSFQAGSVSSKDDPAQSSVSPCAVSSYQEVIFCPKTLLHYLNLQDSFFILTPKLCPTCQSLSVVSPFITIYQSLQTFAVRSKIIPSFLLHCKSATH